MAKRLIQAELVPASKTTRLRAQRVKCSFNASLVVRTRPSATTSPASSRMQNQLWRSPTSSPTVVRLDGFCLRVPKRLHGLILAFFIAPRVRQRETTMVSAGVSLLSSHLHKAASSSGSAYL